MLLAGMFPPREPVDQSAPVAPMDESCGGASVGSARAPGDSGRFDVVPEDDGWCVISRVPFDSTTAAVVVRLASGDERVIAEYLVSRAGRRSSRRLLQSREGDPLRPWQNRAFEQQGAVPGYQAAANFPAVVVDDGAGWRVAVLVPAAIGAAIGGEEVRTVTVLSVDRSGRRRVEQETSVRHPVRRRAVAVTPIALGTVRQQRSGLIGTTSFQELGGEATLTPASWLMLRAAVRPQFTETEPDEQRINLTRYRLLLPDRRGGLDDLDARFDPLRGDRLALFHSRRLGFDSLGRAAPIAGYGRVAARAFGADVEGLVLSSDETRNQRRQVYAAGRFRRRIGRLEVGGLALQREAPDAPFEDRNRTAAIDASFQLSGAWRADGWTALTRSPRFVGGDQAYGFGVARRGGAVEAAARFEQVGEFFNPEMGLLTDRGVRRVHGALAWSIGAGVPGAWTVRPGIDYAGQFRLGDGLHQASTGRLAVGVLFPGGWLLEPSISRRHEGLTAPFTVGDSTTLRPGHYRWVEAALTAHGNIGSALTIDGRFEAGGLYDGSQVGGGMSVDWRPAGWMTAAVLTDVTHVRLPRGGFDRVLVGARILVRPTRRTAVSTLIQYNNSVRLWTANARITWHDRWGTGVTIALEDAHEADRLWRWVRPQVRTVSIKLSKQLDVGPRISR